MAVFRSAPLRELSLVLACVVGSLVLLPGVIYIVGLKLFGAYQGGLGQFYLSTLKDLATPTWPAWVLALGPAVSLLLLRGIWLVRFAGEPNVAAQATRQEPTL